MRIFLNLIPVILITLIAYVFSSMLLPTYKQTISLAREFNKLRNQEKDLIELERIINELNKDRNISSLLAQKETLETWLPREPKITEIIAYLVNTYRVLNLGEFPGSNFNISKEENYFVSPYVLPVSTVNFGLSFEKIDLAKLQEFVSYIDKSSRLMEINKASLSWNEKENNLNANFEVGAYYLILMPLKNK